MYRFKLALLSIVLYSPMPRSERQLLHMVLFPLVATVCRALCMDCLRASCRRCRESTTCHHE